MRSIPLLVVDAATVFDEIAAAKTGVRRKRMRAARARVIAAYAAYQQATPEVGALQAADITDLQKNVMVHAYSVETRPMKKLRTDLIDRVVAARCPMCGISESSTLDHYLPKEQFPEFAVFPPNLVPSCASCNTLKRDKILEDGSDVRMFIHPCLDTIPTTDFLDVQTRMEADALILSYRLRRPAGMTARTFQHLRNHFTQLNLADRYRRMGLEHLGGLYPALRRAYGASENAHRVEEKLTEGAEDFEAASGPNNWLAKLYRALAANNDFCGGGFEAVKVERR